MYLGSMSRLPADKPYFRGNNGEFSNPIALPVKQLF